MATIITSGLTVTSSYGSKYFGNLPILADDESVSQWCTENGYEPSSEYTQDNSRWSNDGARLMNRYGSIDVVVSGGTETKYYWFNVYGYGSIVTSITIPDAT
jgi:hypothetical protein